MPKIIGYAAASARDLRGNLKKMPPWRQRSSTLPAFWLGLSRATYLVKSLVSDTSAQPRRALQPFWIEDRASRRDI
jgi:hypothetical protein